MANVNAPQPTSQSETVRLLLLDLMKYRKMPTQAPIDLLRRIVQQIDPSYDIVGSGLYGCGSEAFIIKVQTPMSDERCLKIVFPSEGIEGQRTVTFWDTFNIFGGEKVTYQIKNESISRMRFKEGAKLQAKIRAAIQETRVDYFTVPAVYKVSDTPLYIEMEWVPSVPILQYLHEQKDLMISLQCFCNLCKAATFIHERGIIHRDLKPDNIYIWNNLSVCILDWSIAKEIGDRNLTVIGLCLGATPYISPVQAENAKEATQLDDIHYLGYTFASFIYDRDLPILLEPINKNNYSRVLKKYRDKINSELPEIMRPIFLKATEIDETKRYPTADAMREDVEKVLATFTKEQNVFVPQPSVVITPEQNPLNDKTPIFTESEERPTPPRLKQIDTLDAKCLARFLSDQMVKDCAKTSAAASLKRGINSEEICPETCDYCRHVNESLILTIIKVIQTMKEWRYL